MKLHYYLMSMALMATASVSFTACDDDDETFEPVTVIESDKDNGSLNFDTTEITVKVGPDNMVAVPVSQSAGELKAYSLNPEIARVVDVNGTPMIEGLDNGTCRIMVGDGSESYKAFTVNVYTTDALEFAKDVNEVDALLGSTDWQATVKIVSLGNGGYTATTDDPNVKFVSSTKDGIFTFTVAGKKDPYTVNVTVKDCRDVVGTTKLKVNPTFNPFDENRIDELYEGSSNDCYLVCAEGDGKMPSYQGRPYYYGTSFDTASNWSDTVEDGICTFGWQLANYGGLTVNGGLLIKYPATAKVGEEVQGTVLHQYASGYTYHSFTGTVKVVRDDDVRKVVVFYAPDQNIDMINYAYITYMK